MLLINNDKIKIRITFEKYYYTNNKKYDLKQKRFKK